MLVRFFGESIAAPVILLFLVVATALTRVYIAFDSRVVSAELQSQKRIQHRHEIEIGRLLIEVSTLSTPAMIEQRARDELSMREPGEELWIFGRSTDSYRVGDTGKW